MGLVITTHMGSPENAIVLEELLHHRRDQGQLGRLLNFLGWVDRKQSKDPDAIRIGVLGASKVSTRQARNAMC